MKVFYCCMRTSINETKAMKRNFTESFVIKGGNDREYDFQCAYLPEADLTLAESVEQVHKCYTNMQRRIKYITTEIENCRMNRQNFGWVSSGFSLH